jgi:hypothetical protein
MWVAIVMNPPTSTPMRIGLGAGRRRVREAARSQTSVTIPRTIAIEPIDGQIPTQFDAIDAVVQAMKKPTTRVVFLSGAKWLFWIDPMLSAPFA